MRLHYWLVAVLFAGTACGDVINKKGSDGGVDGTTLDGPSVDAPTCAPGSICVDGTACTAASQCASGHCECSDAACAAKVCSAAPCACQFSSAGATCDGYLSLGYDDAADTCGASVCDGTGACGLPLIWYKLDEPAGGAIQNSGTWPGSPTTVAGTLGVPGKLGTAIKLGSPSDGISIADPADGSLDGFSSWTVSGWVNLTTLPVDGYATLVKKDLGYLCRLVESASCVDCYTSQTAVWTPAVMSSTWQMPTAPVIGTWYHMACTYTNGTLTFYWNGSPMSSLSGGGAMFADSADAFGVGKSPAGGENLQGSIDDLQLWNAARTARQVCLDACGSFAGSTCTFDGVCGN